MIREMFRLQHVCALQQLCFSTKLCQADFNNFQNNIQASMVWGSMGLAPRGSDLPFFFLFAEM